MTATCVASQTSRLMLDHPGWFTTPGGYAQRAFRSGGTVWLLTCRQLSITFEPTIEVVCQGMSDAEGDTDADANPGMDGDTDDGPLLDCFDPAQLPPPFRDTPIIRDYGHLHRIRGCDLWESMLPPLVRRRNLAEQSIQRYRTLCAALGGRVTTSLGTVLTAPRAETVVAASGDDWGGLAQPWVSKLRKAAEVYLERQEAWARYPPDALYYALHDVHGIGALSAAEIVADLTNDFSRYEFVDFGTPGRWEQFAHDLGENSSTRDFEVAWHGLTPSQRSTLTALSIDWRLRERGRAQHLRFR